jgi:CubicO group peptidase (beta-lactamase class C family)
MRGEVMRGKLALVAVIAWVLHVTAQEQHNGRVDPTISINAHNEIPNLCARCQEHSFQSLPANSRVYDAVTPYLANHSIAGVVTLVTNKERTIDLEAFGYSDIAAKRLMKTDSIFWIASMSKPITATALMMLVDEDKAHLDDPVQKYLPDFQPRILRASRDGESVRVEQPRTQITLRQLLNHTSGIPFTNAVEAEGADRYRLAVRVQSYAMTPLQFEPGTEYSYSSAGINVIGRVVEVVSGIPFEAFLKANLFDPLQMQDTGFWLSGSQLPRLASAYFADGSNELYPIQISRLHRPYNDSHSRFSFPGGGLFSTASDLAKFCRMILNDGSVDGHRYLSPKAINEMTKNQLSDAVRRNGGFMVGEGYGLGWMIGPGDRVGHSGAEGTSMEISPKDHIAAIWMVQLNDAAGGSTAARKAFEGVIFNSAVEEHF